jgi:hypothetical protein
MWGKLLLTTETPYQITRLERIRATSGTTQTTLDGTTRRGRPPTRRERSHPCHPAPEAPHSEDANTCSN